MDEHANRSQTAKRGKSCLEAAPSHSIGANCIIASLSHRRRVVIVCAVGLPRIRHHFTSLVACSPRGCENRAAYPWSTTIREIKNLKLLGGVEVALASENSKFLIANSHLPNPLASGDLLARDSLPSERAMTVANAA